MEDIRACMLFASKTLADTSLVDELSGKDESSHESYRN